MTKSLSASVWTRSSSSRAHTLSKNLYALSITGFTAAGIIFAALMSRLTLRLHFTSSWQPIVMAAGVLLVSLLGIVIFNASDKPAVSLLGYALVAGPFGLLLGPMVAQYTKASVIRVFAVTTLLVLVLGIVGAIIPESLESWRGWLLGGLIILLVGYFAAPIFALFGLPIGGALTALDWVGVLLFSGLVIFDLNRAMRLPRTLDNSIDAAAAVFLDFINIFIRLLALTGQESND